MARPRTIKLGDNKEVLLKNFSVEEADKLKAFVTAKAETIKAETVEAASELTNIALSTYKAVDGWKLVVLRYNPVTNAAVVVEMISCSDQYEAAEEFKMRAAREDLV